MELHFTNLLIVVAVGFTAPFALGFFPRLRLPAIVFELVLGIVLGPAVLGWVNVDEPVAVMSLIGLAVLLFLAGIGHGDQSAAGADLGGQLRRPDRRGPALGADPPGALARPAAQRRHDAGPRGRRRRAAGLRADGGGHVTVAQAASAA